MDETSESGGNLSTLSSLSEIKNESNYSTANKTAKKKKQKRTDEANFGSGGSVCRTLTERKGRRGGQRAKSKSKREEVSETDQRDAVPQRRKRKKKVPTSESLSPSSSTYEIEYQLHSPKPTSYAGVDVDVDIESIDEDQKPKVSTRRIDQRGRRYSEDKVHARNKTPRRSKTKKNEPASETSSTRNLPRKSNSAGEARPVPVRSSPRSRRKLKFSSSSTNVDRSVRSYFT